MIEDERYKVTKQIVHYGVIDTLNKTPIINQIHRTQAVSLANHLNNLNDEKDIITDDYVNLQKKYDKLKRKYKYLNTGINK